VAAGLTGLELLERGAMRTRKGRVLLSNLPDAIAERELEELSRLGPWSTGELVHEKVFAQGPGNVILIELEYEHVTEMFVGFGEYGVKSEVVAKRAIEAMRQYLVCDVPVGPHLADQLLLPMGLCAWQSRSTSRGRSSFRTMPLTDHSRTHIAVLQAFLGISIAVEERPNGAATVTVG
jgi:RNA 3'-terminal phosphate cyclase (ATP)